MSFLSKPQYDILNIQDGCNTNTWFCVYATQRPWQKRSQLGCSTSISQPETKDQISTTAMRAPRVQKLSDPLHATETAAP